MGLSGIMGILGIISLLEKSYAILKKSLTLQKFYLMAKRLCKMFR